MSSKDTLPDHPFWRFASKISAQEATGNILKSLEEHHFKTNILLFCCWFAIAGQGRLSKSGMQKLVTTISLFHERILLPLQKLLLTIKKLFPQSEILHKEMNVNEALVQQIEQLMLTDAVVKYSRISRTPEQKLADTCKNIALFCRASLIHLEFATQQLLLQLLTLLFPQVTALEIQNNCQEMFLEIKKEPGLKQKTLHLD
jgi:hypothetical protein